MRSSRKDKGDHSDDTPFSSEPSALSRDVEPSEAEISGEAIRQGDDTAFTRIYAEVVPRLLDLAESYVGSAADAEEIVQDVVMSMWENREAFLPTGNVMHYLLRAVRNRAVNALKQRNATARLIDGIAAEQESLSPSTDVVDDVDSETASPNDTAAGRSADYPQAFWDAYEHAVGQLPERCRDVYLLHRIGHLSYPDVALTLGISVHTVNGHMGRALRLLRHALQHWRPLKVQGGE